MNSRVRNEVAEIFCIPSCCVGCFNFSPAPPTVDRHGTCDWGWREGGIAIASNSGNRIFEPVVKLCSLVDGVQQWTTISCCRPLSARGVQSLTSVGVCQASDWMGGGVSDVWCVVG